MRRAILFVLGSLLLAPLLACQKAAAPNPAPAAGARVESPRLGITLASVPAGFRVAANQEAELRLERAGPPGGTLSFEVGDHETGGVNLVEAVKQNKTRIEALPEGKYMGNVELASQLGTAFTSRGRYRGETGEVEELRAFAIHPSGDRLLTLIYSYPAGADSKDRAAQLMEVLGEVEPASPAPPG